MEPVLLQDTEPSLAAVAPIGRLAHLDALKTVLTAAVIVAHAAMTYGAVGTWVYEEDTLSDTLAAVLDVLVGGGVMFALGLFYLLAGVLTTRPPQRIGPSRFLRSRLVRLGLPVVLYALVVWPTLHWLIRVVVGDGPRSVFESYRNQFAGSTWQEPGTGPMWFVEILLVVTACWCLWRRAKPTSASRNAAPVIWTAVLVIAVTTFVVRTAFPIDSAQFIDLHAWLWPQAFVLFVIGAVGSEQGWIAEIPADLRRRLQVALLAGAAMLAMFIMLADDGPEPFIAQGPVLVAIALVLRSAGLPGDIDFVVLAVLGVTVSFLVGLAGRTQIRLAPESIGRPNWRRR